MNNFLTRDFLSRLYEARPRQKKSIEKILQAEFEKADFEELESVLSFYTDQYGMEYVVDSYLTILDDTATETMYFLQNGRYRRSTFAEVDQLVYDNPDYMKRYMIGLAISDYLWTSHLKITHWFKGLIAQNGGAERYLEIGPGHGHYFLEAVQAGGFAHYDAIDISDASIEQTKAFLKKRLPDVLECGKVSVFKQDCYSYEPDSKYDMIAIAEVLEHLERPEEMVERAYSLLNPGGRLYVTVPVNAPAIDHIHLFRTIREVEDLITESGFEITDRCYAVEGGMDPVKAERQKRAIIVGLLGVKKS